LAEFILLNLLKSTTTSRVLEKHPTLSIGRRIKPRERPTANEVGKHIKPRPRRIE